MQPIGCSKSAKMQKIGKRKKDMKEKSVFKEQKIKETFERNGWFDKGNKQEFINRICKNDNVTLDDIKEYSKEIKRNTSKEVNPGPYLILTRISTN